MKKFISGILTMLLLTVSLIMPTSAASASAKFNLADLQKQLNAMQADLSSNPNLAKLYDTRIKSITKHFALLNEDIAAGVPAAKTKELKLALEQANSLVQSKSKILKSATAKNYAVYEKKGAPQKIDEKDLKITANLSAKMRKEIDNAMVFYKLKKAESSKAQEKSEPVPSTNVTTRYQSGQSWESVRASLNELVGPAYSIAESGNLTQGDGVSPTNINVISSGNSYKIHITGWRRSKTDTSGNTLRTLEKTQMIFAFFFGNSAGTALFNMKDDIATGNFTSASDYGFVDKESGTASGTLTYTNGTRIYYESDGTYTAFYVG